MNGADCCAGHENGRVSREVNRGDWIHETAQRQQHNQECHECDPQADQRDCVPWSPWSAGTREHAHAARPQCEDSEEEELTRPRELEAALVHPALDVHGFCRQRGGGGTVASMTNAAPSRTEPVTHSHALALTAPDGAARGCGAGPVGKVARFICPDDICLVGDPCSDFVR